MNHTNHKPSNAQQMKAKLDDLDDEAEPKSMADAIAEYCSYCPCDDCLHVDRCAAGTACGLYLLWICEVGGYKTPSKCVVADRNPCVAYYQNMFATPKKRRRK